MDLILHLAKFFGLVLIMVVLVTLIASGAIKKGRAKIFIVSVLFFALVEPLFCLPSYWFIFWQNPPKAWSGMMLPYGFLMTLPLQVAGAYAVGFLPSFSTGILFGLVLAVGFRTWVFTDRFFSVITSLTVGGVIGFISGKLTSSLSAGDIRVTQQQFVIHACVLGAICALAFVQVLRFKEVDV